MKVSGTKVLNKLETIKVFMVYDFLANVKLSLGNVPFELPKQAQQRAKYLEGTFPVSREYKILVGEKPTKNTEDKLRMIALIRQTCYSIEPKD